MRRIVRGLPLIAHWTRVDQSTRCWCVHCDMSGGDFRLSGELDGSSPRLELTAQRGPTHVGRKSGIGDRWQRCGLGRGSDACIQSPSCVRSRGKKNSSNGSNARRESEQRRIRAVAWLGSDWAELTEGFRCAFTLRAFLSFPFLSFTFPSPRVPSRSRAFTSRAVHSVNRDSVDSDVARHSELFLPPFRSAVFFFFFPVDENCGTSRDHRNFFNADCCLVKLLRLWRLLPIPVAALRPVLRIFRPTCCRNRTVSKLSIVRNGGAVIVDVNRYEQIYGLTWVWLLYEF